MADPPHPPDVTPAGDDPAPASPEQSPCSPAQSDRTAIAAMEDIGPQYEPEPCTGSAMFSTEMGMRAPRKVPGPPYPPVIVRSDKVAGVVVFAHLWLKRYPLQYLCIFGNCGWTIHDLWDPADIHLESPSFCQETLNFIERDNYYRAKGYAIRWSQAHREWLSIIGGDMTDLYDPQSPLSLVDKIFVDGEVNSYPRTFLWHVAHIMRASMVEAARTRPVANLAGIGQQEVAMGAQRVVGVSSLTPTAESTPMQRTMSDSQVNRRGLPSHIPEYERMALPTAESMTPMSTMHTATMRYPDPHTTKRKISHGPPRQGDYQHEMMGPMRIGVTGPQAILPHLSQQGLHISKGKFRQKGSDIYGRSMQPTGWVENGYRGVSGMHRNHSGSSSTMPSPHFNPASMAAGQPVGNALHMMPFAPGHHMPSPSMSAVQPIHPGMMQHGRMPPHAMPMPDPSVVHPYLRHPSDGPGPPGLIADATNMPYTVDMTVSNNERRRSSARHNGQYHNNGGALFDPYDGSRPSFNSPAAPHSGKKHHQNGFQNQPGRSRKFSIPTGRPDPVQYGPEKSGNAYYNGNRGYGFNARHSTEDNPAITQDPEKGCHSHWIGPKNETVTEVFIGDLPEDIQVTEIEGLFKLRIGILPAFVTLRFSPPSGHRHQSRRHAFVMFNQVSEAKQAISIPEPILRESRISITVPKRFYQKSGASPPMNAVETTLHSGHSKNGGRTENQVTQVSSSVPTSGSNNSTTNEMPVVFENPIYSPQDARSGLQKKPEHMRQPVSSSTGSPKARKSGPKKHQESPTKASKKKHASSGIANVGTSEHPATPKVNESTSIEYKASPDKPRAPDLETRSQPSGQDLRLSKSLPVTDRSSGGPPVQMSNIAQDASAAVVDARKGQNDGAVQQSAEKREEAGVPSTLKLESTGASILSMGPIITKHVSPTEPSVPEASKAMIGSSAENEGAASPKKAAPGDDIKSDIGFYSAQESQTDCPATVPVPVPQADKMSVHNRKSISVITDGLPSQASSNVPARTVATPISLERNEDLTPQVASKENSAPNPEIKEQDRPKLVTPTEPAKRDSTPQTQSLFPFARPSKNQLKREKEQKKKALRKEKAEQAEKLKATKTAASGKTNEGSTAKSKAEQFPLGESSMTHKGDEVAGTAAGRGKEADGRISNEKAQPNASGRAETKYEAGHHGKQNGVNASSLSNEIDSETPKATANSSRLSHTSEHILSPLDSPLLSSQSSALGSTIGGKMEDGRKMLAPTIVSLESAVDVTEAHASSPTPESLVSTIEGLSLHSLPQPSTPPSENSVQTSSKQDSPPKEPLPTVLAGSAIVSEDKQSCFTHQAVGSTPGHHLRNSHDSQGMDHTSLPSHAVPRALPTPLQIDESASDTYSPGRDEFHTPLQTPSGLMTQNEHATIDKKKGSSKTARNNARKKKNARLQQADKTTEADVSTKPTTPTATNEPIREDEPFSSQMIHIDAVRDGTVVNSQDSQAPHTDYARDLMRDYGHELGWDLEEVTKISKPSGENVDSEAVRRYDAAQIRAAEIWVRETRPHEKLKDLGGFWSKEEMSKRGAI